MKLFLGGCLEIMKKIPAKSIDLILCDLPYGTTSCKWDSVIPFEPLWEHYNRLIVTGGAIVLFGSEPFSSALRMSNIKSYRYEWYLKKQKVTNHLNARIQPMRRVETVSVFNSTRYFPQGLTPHGKVKNRYVSSSSTRSSGSVNFQEYTGYPVNLIEHIPDKEILHPTQKPVALMEYLIKTYSNEGETVLDNCMGSGTTGVACANTGRGFIGIEQEQKYFDIASRRIKEAEINCLL